MAMMPLIIDIIIIMVRLPLLNPAPVLDKNCIRVCQNCVVEFHGFLCSPECVYTLPMLDVRFHEFDDMLLEQIRIKFIRAFVAYVRAAVTFRFFYQCREVDACEVVLSAFADMNGENLFPLLLALVYSPDLPLSFLMGKLKHILGTLFDGALTERRFDVCRLFLNRAGSPPASEI